MWLLWTRTFHGPIARLAFDGPDGQPAIDDNLKDHILAQHRLKPDEENLGFEELAALYPAPCVNPAEAAE